MGACRSGLRELSWGTLSLQEPRYHLIFFEEGPDGMEDSRAPFVFLLLLTSCIPPKRHLSIQLGLLVTFIMHSQMSTDIYDGSPASQNGPVQNGTLYPPYRHPNPSFCTHGTNQTFDSFVLHHIECTPSGFTASAITLGQVSLYLI